MNKENNKTIACFTVFEVLIITVVAWLTGFISCNISCKGLIKGEVPLEIITPQNNNQVDSIAMLKQNFEQYYPGEFDTIYEAALRNELSPEQEILLFAIRKAENGPAGLEFGVMSPYAKDTNLDRQAGACAFEIKRHVPEVTEQAILAFADRYCPPSVDKQGNENWKHNVIFWFIKLGGKL